MADLREVFAGHLLKHAAHVKVLGAVADGGRAQAGSQCLVGHEGINYLHEFLFHSLFILTNYEDDVITLNAAYNSVHKVLPNAQNCAHSRVAADK